MFRFFRRKKSKEDNKVNQEPEADLALVPAEETAEPGQAMAVEAVEPVQEAPMVQEVAPEPAVEPELEVLVKPEPEVVADAQSEPEVVIDAEPELKPVPAPEPAPTPKPEPEPEPEVVSSPDPEPEPEPEPEQVLEPTP